jgi:hypothetical protein
MIIQKSNMNNYTNYLNQQAEFIYGQGINPDYAIGVTKSFIIGRNGVAGCDFNFAAPANTTQQNLSIGPIIFGQCVITQVAIVCLETVAGGAVSDFKVSCGNVSAGVQFIALSTCKTLNQFVQLAAIPALDWSVVNNVFFGGVPTGANWSALTNGKWQLQVIYNDFSKL